MKCPHCFEEIANGASRCSHCSGEIVNCRKCGVSKGARKREGLIKIGREMILVCTGCGREMKEVTHAFSVGRILWAVLVFLLFLAAVILNKMSQFF